MSTQSGANTMTDPLVEQSEHNTLNKQTPLHSGSLPRVEAEANEQTSQKNIIETKMEEAFGKEQHDKEISGAGVGSHPRQ